METLTLLFNLAVILFVVTTMLSMGFGLRLSQIIEPLKDPLLIAVMIVTNFVLIPLAVLAVVWVVPVDEGTKIGLLILSLSAGAPFTPKLAEIAKGDTALATAVMLLLMVATVLILPFGLPILLGGEVSVDSLSIAKSLVVMMIVPLAIALWVRAKFEHFAQRAKGYMVKTSNLMLLAIIVLMSILNGKDIMAVFGYDMVALLLFLVAALLIGYMSGGKEGQHRVVASLSAGQRNISAALVVAAQNFDDPKVSIIIIAVSIIGLVVLLLTARRFAK